MNSLLLLAFASTLLQLSQGLYFYLQADTKCFLEELPRNTQVVGVFKTEEYSDYTKSYAQNPHTGLQVIVDEVTTGNRVLDQRLGAAGKFSFTTQESGEHTLCLSTNTSTWLTTVKTRVHLDITLGDLENNQAQSAAKGAINDLSFKVRDLNARIMNIRREQQYQREREAEFRDLSEHINARVVLWTFIQLIVLGATAVWQMRNLKHFFSAKKLV